MKRSVALSFVCGCQLVVGIRQHEIADADVAMMDGGVDAPVCNPAAPFGAPTVLPISTSTYDEMGGTPSADGTRFYFARRPAQSLATASGYRVWVATRTSLDNLTAPTPVLELEPAPDASEPSAMGSTFNAVEAPGGLRLFLYSYRQPAATGFGGVFTSTRSTTSSTWGAPVLHPVLNSGIKQGAAYPAPNAVYHSWTLDGGNSDLWRSVADHQNGIVTLGARIDDGTVVNSNKGDYWPVVTPDERFLYFSTNRFGTSQIMESKRAAASDPWSAAQLLPSPINGAGALTFVHYVTPDNCTLYYSSSGAGTMDMYVVTRGF